VRERRGEIEEDGDLLRLHLLRVVDGERLVETLDGVLLPAPVSGADAPEEVGHLRALEGVLLRGRDERLRLLDGPPPVVQGEERANDPHPGVVRLRTPGVVLQELLVGGDRLLEGLAVEVAVGGLQKIVRGLLLGRGGHPREDDGESEQQDGDAAHGGSFRESGVRQSKYLTRETLRGSACFGQESTGPACAGPVWTPRLVRTV
jgi:hypothetical protein